MYFLKDSHHESQHQHTTAGVLATEEQLSLTQQQSHWWCELKRAVNLTQPDQIVVGGRGLSHPDLALSQAEKAGGSLIFVQR